MKRFIIVIYRRTVDTLHTLDLEGKEDDRIRRLILVF